MRTTSHITAKLFAIYGVTCPPIEPGVHRVWSVVVLNSLRSAFAGLWGVLSTAQWTANVGLPLSVALAAVLAAYWGIRAQLRLAQRLAREEHRRGAATRYATVSRDLANELGCLVDEVRTLSGEACLVAFTRAKNILGRVHDQSVGLKAALGPGAATEVADQLAAKLLAAAANYEGKASLPDVVDRPHGPEAAAKVLGWFLLRAFGTVLDLALLFDPWDGSEQQPDVSAFTDSSGLPRLGTDHQEVLDWHETVGAEFMTEFERARRPRFFS